MYFTSYGGLYKMRKTNSAFILIGIFIILIIFFVITGIRGYNELIQIQEQVALQQSNIQTQLQRRNDLIPNLVETVKGYASHEQAIFTDIAQARSKLSGATSIDELTQAEQTMQNALNRLLVVVENYPDLKADKQYTALMDELAGTENRIQVARKDYNEIAQAYNSKIKQFPTVIFAGIMGFEKADYFEASDVSQNAPIVSFGEHGAALPNFGRPNLLFTI